MDSFGGEVRGGVIEIAVDVGHVIMDIDSYFRHQIEIEISQTI